MTSPSDLNKVFEIILELPGITVTDVVIEDNAYHVHCTSIFEDAYLSHYVDQMFRCSNELCSHHPGFAHF